MLRRDLLKGFGSLLGISTLKNKEEDYYEQYFKTSYPDNNNNIKQGCKFPLVQSSGYIKDLYDPNISCNGSYDSNISRSGSWGV